MRCGCDQWCRVYHTPEQMNSKHHNRCWKHKEMMNVVSISDSPGGNVYYDKNVEAALTGMIPEFFDGEEYIVKFLEMSQADYDDLPEFQGF